MSSSTLMEVFGHIVYSFTRGVTEHYNPEEREEPLESTGREWYCRPVDELIYQEYSDREATSLDYLSPSSLNVQVIDACKPEENEETQEDQDKDEDKAMAWKRLRPSALRTVCKSMYIGALISLLAATFIGVVFMLVCYVCYKTFNDCQFYPKNEIPLEVQWMRSISGVISCAFLHFWFLVSVLFVFRTFQLMGEKRKLFLVCLLTYCLDSLYRVALQVLGISKSKISNIQKIPLNVLLVVSVCLQGYVLSIHFCTRSARKKMTLFLQMTTPNCLCYFLAPIISYCIYPAYNKQGEEGKLLIALFAPLIGVIVKVISRICVQQLWNITHPGYSFALMAPSYFGSAVVFRVLQAELDKLQPIATLGIIHGAAEVIERSTMVFIDHICHLLWKRTSAPWGSLRTPRRERLMADIAIMSMLYESTAIVSVNSLLYFYQFIFLQDKSLLNLLHKFAINTSVQLVIEWFFTSMSLAVETRYQNMAVFAVWRRRWKRHILVAIVNAIPLAIWTSINLLVIIHERFHESLNHACKMPFT